MICVSLVEPTVAAALRAVRRLSFAELRLDQIEDAGAPVAIERLFAAKASLIATCRPGALSDEERRERLVRAVAAGAAFVDVELESPPRFRRAVIDAALRAGCRVIVSHHDVVRTPGQRELRGLVRRCFAAGAHIAKIACRVHEPRDCARLLSLLAEGEPVIPIGLGDAGRITRVAAPLLGAPFTYAALRADRPAGPGQLAVDELERQIDALQPPALRRMRKGARSP